MSVVADIRAGIERVGWTETARRSGIDRGTLHRSFGKNARRIANLSTVERVVPHIGLALTVTEARQ
jgi:DNA-binding phage protein